MAKRKICQAMAVVLALGMCTTGLTGCGNEKRADGKTEIEVVSYKPEAVKAFEKIEKRFNETHDDIHLTISSPNEAMTILRHASSVRIIRTLSQSVEISLFKFPGCGFV